MLISYAKVKRKLKTVAVYVYLEKTPRAKEVLSRSIFENIPWTDKGVFFLFNGTSWECWIIEGEMKIFNPFPIRKN